MIAPSYSLHIPSSDPGEDDEEPDVKQPPVPPDQEPDVVPVEEPPPPGRERAPMIGAAATLPLALSGCELVGDIFQAGLWVGAIVVLAVLGLIGYVIAKLLR